MKRSDIFNRQTVFISLFFILLTFVFTFPLILHINSRIPGFHSSDEPYAALWSFWWTGYSYINHLDSSKINMIAAPFGRIIDSGYVFWNLISKGLILINGPVVAYNIEVIMSFILTGIITLLLAHYILNSTMCALLTAIIFTFCPYHFVRSWQHLGLAQIQWMPLYFLTFFLLNENKKFKNAIFAAISFSLVMAFDLYYAYFMFIITVAFVIFYFLNQRKIKETRKFINLLLIMGVFILLLESFDLYYITKFMLNLSKTHASMGVYGFIRPFDDLFSQSVRPLSYFLPAAVHPIFGKFTEQFIGSSLYGESFTEHTLYLGWVPLILAFVAFRQWRKNKKSQVTSHKSQVSNDFYIGFFVFLAIVAWLFSQPPWLKIGPVKILMPSFFMYKIAPMFRAYCRFGIVVMLAIAVLAGFGLKFIFNRFKSQKAKAAITGIFCVMVLFEFWNYPPFKVIDVSIVPEVYYWLRNQPGDFAIAEYPLDTDGANVMYLFYQTTHEKKIVNGTTPGTKANKLAKMTTQLSSPQVASVLNWIGVKYVLVHQNGYLETDLSEDKEELSKIPQNKALRLIKRFSAQDCPRKDIMCVRKTGPIDVYEVIASPVIPEIE